MTAISEVGGQKGDLIHLIGIRQQREQTINAAVIGEVQSVYNSGGSLVNSRKSENGLAAMLKTLSDDALLAQVYCDSYLSEMFRRKIKRPHEYLPSAVFSDIIYNKGLSLIYGSVENAHAMNISMTACLFSKRMEVVYSCTARVLDCLGYGLNKISIESESSDFDENGQIARLGEAPKIRHDLAGGIKVDEDFRGWRHPDSD